MGQNAPHTYGTYTHTNKHTHTHRVHQLARPTKPTLTYTLLHTALQTGVCVCVCVCVLPDFTEGLVGEEGCPASPFLFQDLLLFPLCACVYVYVCACACACACARSEEH